MISIDPGSPVPLYRQLVEHFRRAIALGAFREGDRLPTVRDLAAQALVNRNTAARAIQTLEQEGLVRTRVGQGSFVCGPAPKIDRAERDRAVDEAADRLILEARSRGVPLEELGWRLSRRIERFRARLEEQRRIDDEREESES